MYWLPNFLICVTSLGFMTLSIISKPCHGFMAQKNWSRMNSSDVTSNDKFGLPWHGRYTHLADVVGVAGPYRRSDGRRAPNLGPTSGGARALPEVDLVVAVQLLVVVSGRERLVAEFQGGRSPNAFFIFVHWATGEQLKREPGREIEFFFASRLLKKLSNRRI